MKKVIENLNESEIDVFKRMTQIDLSNNDLNNETCKEPTNNDLVSKLKTRLFIRLILQVAAAIYTNVLVLVLGVDTFHRKKSGYP